VCAWHGCAQFGQDLPEPEQAALRADPRTRALSALVEAQWQEWGGRAANNIAWAQAVLGHGSPTLLDKACSP
jgi:hypothetical protein